MRGALPVLLLTASQLFGWSSSPKICGALAGMLVTDFPYGKPVSELPRVEVRQCPPEASGVIQIDAFASGAAEPALVIDTGDFGVVQAIARANVFVIETGGATRDQVFAITYQRGTPQLSLRRTTRGTANVTVRQDSIEIEIGGIFRGFAPPGKEISRFHLDLEEIRYR